MTADTYELIYWPFWALVDVSRLILEHTGTSYKYSPIQSDVCAVLQDDPVLPVRETHLLFRRGRVRRLRTDSGASQS
jgi:hypothetical protein